MDYTNGPRPNLDNDRERQRGEGDVEEERTSIKSIPIKKYTLFKKKSGSGGACLIPAFRKQRSSRSAWSRV